MSYNKFLNGSNEMNIKTSKLDIPRNVTSSVFMMAVYDLYARYERGQLDLYPVYQRNIMVNKSQRATIMENVLQGIPLPSIIYTEDENYNFEIIDGQARIRAIFDYINNEYPLADMYTSYELEGYYFNDLPQNIRRRIHEYNLIMVNVRVESEPKEKLDVYKSIHMISKPLSKQEMRHYVFAGEGMNLVKRLSNTKEFRQIGFSKVGSKEEEVILRYLSFYIKGYKNYHGKFSDFLDDTLQNYRKYESQLWDIENRFTDSINLAYEVLGNKPFSRKKNSRYKLNSALFEIIAVAFSKSSRSKVLKNSFRIREELQKKLKDDKFIESITIKTYSQKAINTRFGMWFDFMMEFMEEKYDK